MLTEAGEIITVNGIELFVRAFGDPSQPVLILLHGGPTWDHSYLLPAAADLADTRHVVLLDLRGNGRSGRHLPIDMLQPEYVVDDIRALIDYLDADQVDLLGFSYGGSIAMQFVARFPTALRSVILASACAYDDDLDELLDASSDYRERSPLTAGVDPADYIGAPDGALSHAMALDSLPLNVWDRSRWSQWREVLDRVIFSDDWGDAFVAGGVHRASPTDPAAALREAGVPLLILHGKHEMSFPVSLAERLHDEVPGSRLVLVPDAAHMAHFDNPGAWTAAIRDFVADHETRPHELRPAVPRPIAQPSNTRLTHRG